MKSEVKHMPTFQKGCCILVVLFACGNHKESTMGYGGTMNCKFRGGVRSVL